MCTDISVSLLLHYFIELKPWPFSFSQQPSKQKYGIQEQFYLRKGWRWRIIKLQCVSEEWQKEAPLWYGLSLLFLCELMTFSVHASLILSPIRLKFCLSAAKGYGK